MLIPPCFSLALAGNEIVVTWKLIVICKIILLWLFSHKKTHYTEKKSLFKLWVIKKVMFGFLWTFYMLCLYMLKTLFQKAVCTSSEPGKNMITGLPVWVAMTCGWFLNTHSSKLVRISMVRDCRIRRQPLFHFCKKFWSVSMSLIIF